MRVTVPTQELLDALTSDAPMGVTVDLWDFSAPPPAGHIDLAVQPYMAPASGLDVLKGADAGWVQSQALGFDNVQHHLPAGVGYSNAVGVHEASTAELALALILAAQRDIPGFVRDQDAERWHQRFEPGLLDLTALVVGVGGVGADIIRLLQACGMTVLRSASRARTDDLGPIGGPDDLPDQLSRADVVVLVTPLTDATRHLADAEFLGHMKPGALLVNVGRGPLVDTDALVAAASEHRVRAALDVTDPEPLPADHPLWTTPGVLITPHVGGRTTTMLGREVALIRRQIEHFVAGEPFEHAVKSVMR